MTKNKKTYITVITFLILEALAFLAFTLTNSIILYSIAGVGLLFAVLYINIDNIKLKDFRPLVFVLVPLVIFGLMHIVSPYLAATNGSAAALLASLAMIAFFALGYLSQTLETFSLSKALLVIYTSLSVLMIISLIFLLIGYRPMYTWFNAGDYIYYQGNRVLLSENTKMLYGFGIAHVSIQYFQLFATVLFSSVIGLVKISPKQNTREFVLYAFNALVGLISIIFTINKLNLLTFAVIFIYLLVILFLPKDEKGHKIVNYICIVLLALFVILGLIFVLNSLNVSFVSDIISSNKILDKIFNSNLISSSYLDALKSNIILNNGAINWFGLNVGAGGLYTSEVISSGNILIDTLSYTGVIGCLAFVIFSFFAFKQLITYFYSSKDDDTIRSLVVGFVGTFYLYCMFGYDMTPLREIDNDFSVLPFSFNGLFFVVLFLIGRAYLLNKSENKVIVEESVIIEESEEPQYEEENL